MKLTVSFSPHALARHTISSYNTTWLIAAAPAAVAGIYFYGLRAAVILALTTLSALLTEALAKKIMNKPASLEDRHAALIGFLVGLTLSPAVPWWLALIAAATAVAMGKMFFGGLGFYPFHPVLVGWVVCYLSWPDLMGTYITPQPGAFWPGIDEAQLPLMLIKMDPSEVYTYGFWTLFLGAYPGPIGATSALAVIVGGLFLFIRGYLPPLIPVGMLLGVFITALIYSALDPDLYAPAWWHLFTGTLMLSAVLLAPEPTTSPMTTWGLFLFGLGAGLTTIMIRVYGPHPDGAFFGVLAFNALTPILDRIKPKPLGRISLA